MRTPRVLMRRTLSGTASAWSTHATSTAFICSTRSPSSDPASSSLSPPVKPRRISVCAYSPRIICIASVGPRLLDRKCMDVWTGPRSTWIKRPAPKAASTIADTCVPVVCTVSAMLSSQSKLPS